MRFSHLARHAIAALVAAALLPLPLLSGCSWQGSSQGSAQGAADGAPLVATDAQLVGTRWTCTELEGTELPEGAPPSLAFDGGDAPGAISVAGHSGVNRFGGSATIADGTLSFGALMSTRMAGPPERMQLEAAYLAMLQSVDGASIVGDTLTLSAGGRRVATFVRAAE